MALEQAPTSVLIRQDDSTITPLDGTQSNRHFICTPGHVIPLLAAETLSRSLGTIPIYSRLHSTEVAPLSNAIAYSSDTRSALKRSLDIANSIAALLPQLIHKLQTFAEAPQSALHAIELVEEAILGAAFLARRACDAIAQVYQAAGKISKELDAQLQLRKAALSHRRWTSAIRVAGICVAVPSFVTTVLASIWNSSHPNLSFAMAVVSSSTGICGTLAPAIAQWYWECKDNLPWSDMQAARIEAGNIQYPLSVIFKWWKRLCASMLTMGQWDQHALERIDDLKLLVSQVDDYKRQMAAILASVDSMSNPQLLHDADNVV